ncbi:uncharacterized protein LOC115408132 [Salarias fasciatus]|uniref:uncharacterized protein LOC115408132 n=1 Tax=Salarias fasciatus TaxID=181472 RepID=UPI001176C7AA|nr:uncharacterized protein LOC115408132 [Salarias fasciatus]
MTSLICSVHGCHNNYKKMKLSLSQNCFEHGKPRSECCGPAFRLHPPPSKEEDRRYWLRALNLKKPPKRPYVCSFHFVDRQPTPLHPYPEKWLGYTAVLRKPRRLLQRYADASTRNVARSPVPPLHVNLKAEPPASTRNVAGSPVPPLYVDLKAEPPASTRNVAGSPVPPLHVDLKAEPPASTRNVAGSPVPPLHVDLKAEPPASTRNVAGSPVPPLHVDLKAESPASCQPLSDHSYAKSPVLDQPLRCHKATQCSGPSALHITLLRSDRLSLLYTGLPLESFNILADQLTKDYINTFQLDVRDQVLMTLMKLRLNLLQEDLAERFSVSQSGVSRIITTWLDIVKEKIRSYVPLLPRETILATMPQCLKEHHPTTTCVIDCSETPPPETT